MRSLVDREAAHGPCCANCRRPIKASTALTTGKLCEKCKWAASCAEFRDDAKTNPRSVTYNSAPRCSDSDGSARPTP